MLNKVAHQLIESKLIHRKDTVIVACSGGMDSMALLHLMQQLPIRVVMAHCNFGLRDKESDGDALFLQSYSEKEGLRFYVERFDTKKIASDQGLSIQEAARDLRYEWFEKIRKQEKASCVLTAHHLNDNIETLFFNLAKGTGIKGLRGIPFTNNKIIRPLLQCSKSDIIAYTKRNDIPYREDSSNAILKYDRNKIRHKLVPVLEDINPSLTQTMQDYFGRMASIESIHSMGIAAARKRLLQQREDAIFISKKLLKTFDYSNFLLFELLRNYGFNIDQINDLMGSIDGTEAKVQLSKTHRLISDRVFFIVSKLSDKVPCRIIIDRKTKKVNLASNQFVRLQHKPSDKLSAFVKQSSYAYLDADKLSFPLILRRWKTGDYFYPFGMQNDKPKKKKVSKLLKDMKASLLDKENTWVLVSNEKIAWVVGYRIDGRFSVTSNTKNVLVCTLSNSKRKLQ